MGTNTACVRKTGPATSPGPAQKLQGVALRCIDAVDCIRSMPDGALLFVDAPYFSADQDKFYTCFFSRQDHFRLRDVIRQEYHRLKFFITYDNCEEIREMYSFMPAMYDKEWNYCISRTDDQRNTKSCGRPSRKAGQGGASFLS